MTDPGEICGVYEHRKNPDESSLFEYQYKVRRTNRHGLKWESLEEVLAIDVSYPMKKHCSDALIAEYHEYVMEYAQKTAERERKDTEPLNEQQANDNDKESTIKKNKSTKSSKKKKSRKRKRIDEELFCPSFDVECVLDEKQESEEEDIQFLIRWKGWPKEYDSWTFASCLNDYSLALVDRYRRSRGGRNLGEKGFSRTYWKELYSKEWQEYMDGYLNGCEHAEYAYYFFKKFGIHSHIHCLADFGFGHGNMLDAFVKKFKPKIAYGLEPSEHVFNEYVTKFNEAFKANKCHYNHCHVHLECIDLIGYIQRDKMSAEQVEIYNEKYHQFTARKIKQNSKKKRKPLSRGRPQKRKKLQIISGANTETQIATNTDNAEKPHNAEHENENEDQPPKQEEEDGKLTEEEFNAVLSNERFKSFCFCGRATNKNYYQRRLNKLGNELPNKNSKSKGDGRNEADVLLSSVYNEFECSCYSKFDGSYQLGLCVSVLQYLSDLHVERVLKYLSRQCDFLYFDVVTHEEYTIMADGGSTFVDKYAIFSRSKQWYLSIITKYWRILSNNILESKWFYPDPQSSNVPNTIFVID
mmetsp:Transcript_15724/g.24923  ORF Transcript_15724/g.24923 Transcript_15724/m.24923 type:complete len:582 (+) Transcript_15724:35-1780(+)